MYLFNFPFNLRLFYFRSLGQNYKLLKIHFILTLCILSKFELEHLVILNLHSIRTMQFYNQVASRMSPRLSSRISLYSRINFTKCGGYVLFGHLTNANTSFGKSYRFIGENTMIYVPYPYVTSLNLLISNFYEEFTFFERKSRIVSGLKHYSLIFK